MKSIYSGCFFFVHLVSLYRAWRLFEKTWHVSNILINSVQIIAQRGLGYVYNDDLEWVWHWYRHPHRHPHRHRHPQCKHCGFGLSSTLSSLVMYFMYSVKVVAFFIDSLPPREPSCQHIGTYWRNRWQRDELLQFDFRSHSPHSSYSLMHEFVWMFHLIELVLS